MGNLEILRAICSYQKDIKCANFINKYLLLLNEEFKNNKRFICGDDGKTQILLNLFLGYAGIGYGFLRQYDWKNMPSILALESSNLEFKYLH